MSSPSFQPSSLLPSLHFFPSMFCAWKDPHKQGNFELSDGSIKSPEIHTWKKMWIFRLWGMIPESLARWSMLHSIGPLCSGLLQFMLHSTLFFLWDLVWRTWDKIANYGVVWISKYLNNVQSLESVLPQNTWTLIKSVRSRGTLATGSEPTVQDRTNSEETELE